MESAGDDAAATEGFDIGDLVEDEEEDGVGKTVEVVYGLGEDSGGEIWTESGHEW